MNFTPSPKMDSKTDNMQLQSANVGPATVRVPGRAGFDMVDSPRENPLSRNDDGDRSQQSINLQIDVR